MLAFPIPFIILLFLIIYGVGFRMIKAFLTAKLKKSLVVFMVRRNRILDIVSGKYEAGTMDIPDGVMLVNPDGVYRLPNNLPAGISFEQYSGVNLTPEVIKASQQLRKEGFQNLQQVNEFVKELQENGNGEEKEKLKGFILEPIHAIQNFLLNIDASFIKSRIEKRVARELEGMRKTDWAKIVMLLVILMIGASIAVYILSMSQSTEMPGWAKALMKSMEMKRVVTANTTTTKPIAVS